MPSRIEQLAAVAGIGARAARRFVEYLGGNTGRYAAVRPDEAFEELLAERQREFEAARAAVAGLLAGYTPA
ncbi:hypothetical protein [Actinophytocola gossypii]|uniref:Uncharacterized protein n=1 Tax=Actinophytocola gossypii TaxID=2812003 RepID=A0ABT2J2U8_9PSEU|nr:hypothetical protein [Actinophytocola gossypii]MCT2582170.1 hypothetical protein [Actinophytocola gossypii]